jgi:hypothetical protein
MATEKSDQIWNIQCSTCQDLTFLHLQMPVPLLAVVQYIITLLPNTAVYFCNVESPLSLADAVHIMDEVSQ